MSTDNLYDHTGLAPRLCASIYRVGAFLLQVQARADATSADVHKVVGEQLAFLQASSVEITQAMDAHRAQDRKWRPSRSLAVAVQDADSFIEELEDLQSDWSALDALHDLWDSAVNELAVDMYTRDHAREVALWAFPDERCQGQNSAADAVQLKPRADDAPPVSNVVQLDRSRRRRPTSTDTTPAG